MSQVPQTLQAEVPWSRLKGEPELWYGRFVKYAKPFGYEYTVKRAYRLFQFDQSRMLTTTLDTDALIFWEKEADRWEWKKRSKYSADEEAVITETIWRQRQLELLERDWQLGDSLRGMIELAVGQYQSYLETTKPGAKPPVSLQHVVSAAKFASDTQRLTLEMPTEITEQRSKKVVMYLPEVEETIDGSDTILEQHSSSSSSNGNDDSSDSDNRKLIEAPESNN
jgi:hypothetical protein